MTKWVTENDKVRGGKNKSRQGDGGRDECSEHGGVDDWDVDQRIQGAGRVGGTLFYDAGGGIWDGSDEAVRGFAEV
jgi:hypothetical protein